MLAPQDISLFLNISLAPTHEKVELDGETGLPDSIRDMPDQVSGHFVELEPSVAHDIESAWKRVMMLNATRVLYTFSYDAPAQRFTAVKR